MFIYLLLYTFFLIFQTNQKRNLLELTDQNYEEHILKNQFLVVAILNDYSKESEILKQVFEQKEESQNEQYMVFAYIYYEKNQEFFNNFMIQDSPSIIIFHQNLQDFTTFHGSFRDKDKIFQFLQIVQNKKVTQSSLAVQRRIKTDGIVILYSQNIDEDLKQQLQLLSKVFVKINFYTIDVLFKDTLYIIDINNNIRQKQLQKTYQQNKDLILQFLFQNFVRLNQQDFYLSVSQKLIPVVLFTNDFKNSDQSIIQSSFQFNKNKFVLFYSLQQTEFEQKISALAKINNIKDNQFQLMILHLENNRILKRYNYKQQKLQKNDIEYFILSYQDDAQFLYVQSDNQEFKENKNVQNLTSKNFNDVILKNKNKNKIVYFYQYRNLQLLNELSFIKDLSIDKDLENFDFYIMDCDKNEFPKISQIPSLFYFPLNNQIPEKYSDKLEYENIKEYLLQKIAIEQNEKKQKKNTKQFIYFNNINFHFKNNHFKYLNKNFSIQLMKQSEMDPSNILSLESYKKINSMRFNQYTPENINFMPFMTLSQSDENSQTLFDSANNSLFQIEEQNENTAPNFHQRIQSNSFYIDQSGKPMYDNCQQQKDQQFSSLKNIQNSLEQNENIFKKKVIDQIDFDKNQQQPQNSIDQNFSKRESRNDYSSKKGFQEPDINSKYSEISLNQNQRRSISRKSRTRKRISVSPDRQKLNYQNLDFIQDYPQDIKENQQIKNFQSQNPQTNILQVKPYQQNIDNKSNQYIQQNLSQNNLRNSNNVTYEEPQSIQENLQIQLQLEKQKNVTLQNRISELESQLADSESEKSQIIQRYEDMLSRSQFKLNLNRNSVHASDNYSMTFAHRTERDSFITPRFGFEKNQDKRKYGSVHDQHF